MWNRPATIPSRSWTRRCRAGIAQGRAELLAELRNLEGIGLDAAIAIAKLTKFAVQYIVKPLADLNSTIQGDILGALAAGVAEAIAILIGIPAVVCRADLVRWARSTILKKC